MKKYKKLIDLLKQYKSAVIAFSGGVDSTFLSYSVREALGDNILLVTATSSTYPSSELEEAKDLAKKMGLEHLVIHSEELEIPGFSENPPDRCYHCKKELFSQIKNIAREKNYDVVLDGNNADDLDDYRPGRKALKELDIISPLCEVGFTKHEIRKLSEKFGLPTANKPAYACLASRFPYGEKITANKLNRVGKAEQKIRELGFTLFRVRSHEDVARVEFIPQEMDKAWSVKDRISGICKDAGYAYVAIDIQGYRMGAMNEVL